MHTLELISSYTTDMRGVAGIIGKKKRTWLRQQACEKRGPDDLKPWRLQPVRVLR
jgi:hypothetical protein